MWGKELKTQLAHVQWSPDGRNIIFCTLQCEVHIYDAIGNYMSKMNLYCLDVAAAATSLIVFDWYDGAEGLQAPRTGQTGGQPRKTTLMTQLSVHRV